jgi:predicted lipid-binding transport protein (Tim44 family)
MDKNRKILIGVSAGVVALCLFFGVVGATFRAGMMMGGRGNTVAYGPRAVPQAVPPAAPQDDQPVAPQAPRQNNGRGFDQNDNSYGQRFNQRGGFGGGFLGFIGGIFRFIGTLLLIGLIVFAVRMLFFKRGWGGPGRWGWGGSGGQGHRGMPPFFEEWHKRAHEPQAAQPAEGDASGPATETKPEDKPQDPQAI